MVAKVNNALRLVVKILFALCLTYAAGWIGSPYIIEGLEWYTTLNKPSWTPPIDTFSPIWTSLYTILALSFFMIIQNKQTEQQKKVEKRKAIVVYCLHLGVNASWPIGFFGYQSTINGLILLTLLIPAAIYSAYLFYKLNKTAGYLWAPYITWLIFAYALNSVLFSIN